ncbi:bacterial Ig-like domain [Candidatus Symbiothrix dinenymphae]|nr:bacterial Ig-like domain [Candidatus Symbiothrix dinenymphae]
MKKIYLWAAAALISMAAPCAQAQNECSSAVPITLGSDDTLTTTASGYHWYTAVLDAGKSYVVNWTSGSGAINVHENCPGIPPSGGHYCGINACGDPAFTVTSSGTYYIDAVGSDGDIFTITELTDPTDNRLCANAPAIALDNVVTLPATTGTAYWYAITLDADKVYAIEWEAGSTGSFELYRTCGGVRITDGTGFIYSPSAADTYYVKARSGSGDGKFTVKDTVLAPGDNRICANATAVTLGTDIAPTTTDGTRYWYKVDLEANKMYELSRINNTGEATLYASCGGGGQAGFYNNTYTATATATYYIEAYRYNADNKFKIAEVTDNRACAYADSLALNTETPAVPSANQRWYKVNLAAGKTYAFSRTNAGSAELYPSCGGNFLMGYGSTIDTYTPSAAGTYYIRTYPNNADDKFKIAEVTDNRVCAYADNLALNTESPALPQYAYRWYKVNLTAGKVYAIERTSNDIYLDVYNTCGGSTVSGNGGLYTIAVSRTYYIRVYSYVVDGKFTVTEVTDNRICANAVPLALNDTITPTAINTEYWYKVGLQAGSSYLFERTGGSGNGDLHATCGGSIIAYLGNIYTPTVSDTFYLRLSGYGVVVSEITDNRICANAEPLDLDTESPALPQYSTRWYTVELEADKGYVIAWLTGDSTTFSAYSSCGGTSVNSTYITSVGTYYISANSSTADGKFKVVEVTDNRSCAYAETLALDTVSPALPQSRERWYKVNLEAGKAYAIEWLSVGNVYGDLYPSCGGNYVNSIDGIYEITTDGTYYLRAYSFVADNKFKIIEVTDNRICANAEPRALNDTIQPTPGAYYWYYKVDLQAGSSYLFRQIDGSGTGNLVATCGGSNIVSLGNNIYTATESGTFHLRLRGNNADFKVKVSEIIDNRICAYAEQIALTDTIKPTATNTGYWYKVNLVAGKDYEMKRTEGNGYLELYNSCGGSYLTGTSGTSQLYRATASGTYYIRVYAYAADSKFKVSEVVITDNRICANATPLALDTESTALSTDTAHWYRLTLTAGKRYEMEITGSLNYNLYSGECGSNTYASLTNITETGTYNLQVSGTANSKFKVKEITDNSVCSNAVPIGLDTAVTPAARYTNYWYTIDFTVGKTYNMQWSLDIGSFSLYDACNGTQLAYGSGINYNYVAPNTGTYYIRANANVAGDAFTVTQTADPAITDNRLCTYAEQIALTDTIKPTSTNIEYWYKVDLTASKSYKFAGKAGGYLNFTLHNDCGGTQLASAYLSGNDSTIYAAVATGTYYVKMRALQDNSTLKISEFTTPPTVQSVQILLAPGSVQKGGTQQFEARVTVLGGAAETVTWSVTGTASNIDADGMLTIGATETAAILVVTATSTEDNTKKASVTVTVTTDQLVAAVLGVTVTPNTASVAKNSTQQFEAVVVVQGNAAQTVTWSVSGDNINAGTSIDPSSGLLTIAAAETASTLTVTATSTVEASKKGSASVTVTEATEIPQTTAAQSIASLQIYPNPAKDELNIRTEQPVERVEIVDIAGRIVLSTNTNIINVSHLPKGVYLVRIAIAGQSITRRIIKE